MVTELPYQANPDNLAIKIAELIKDGKVTGIADLRDETSGRTGQRLVIVLKRDASPKVVLNNLYKHTQLQENFSANMLAIVDGVPRTLSLDAFVRHWVDHQMDVIVRRTRYRLRQAEEEAHILRGLLKALDALDEVIALIRRSPTADEARSGLMEFLQIDEAQAQAILNMQLRRLAALERQKIQDRHDELMRMIAEYNAIIASETRQREIISEELGEIVNRYGDERRTQIMYGYNGDMSMEDLIPEEEVVVTITRGGYIKRTRSDQYRSQHRGGKGIKGASLRGDDVVEHFFVTTTHSWILFFTNLGRVYRAKGYGLQEAGRDAKGQHIANLLEFQGGEHIAQVMELKSYEDAEYLVLATRGGMVKKSRLSDYDTNRTAGLIAINLREGDEVVSAFTVSDKDDILLVSRNGMSLRFHADDASLRPMGRSTSGVTGMKFREGDELISANVVTEGSFVFVVTEGGYAKRTSVDEYRVQGRNGFGIKVAKLVEDRGALVGGLIVDEEDEVLVVMASGKVVRSNVNEVPAKGRDTIGVIFAKPGKGDSIIGVARNQDRQLDDSDDETTENTGASESSEAPGTGGTAKRPVGKRPVNAKRPTGSRRQLVRPAPRSKIRRARLVVQKVDTWSVAKLIFLLSIALGIVTVVASVILWLFLQASGAFTGVNQLISSLGTGSTTVDISQMISLGQVALVTTIFAVVNTVVFTLLGMIGAILYNLAAKLVGGVTLTLSDES